MICLNYSGNLCSGFVAPDGTYHPVLPYQHDAWAEEHYGCDREELIKYYGFVEIYQSDIIGGSTLISRGAFQRTERITEAQIATILALPIDDWDEEARDLLHI